MFERMLVAYDGSEKSRQALEAGVKLAAQFSKPLRVVTVVEGVPSYVVASGLAPVDPALFDQISLQQQTFTERLLAEASAVASGAGVELTTEAVAGDEVAAIVDAVVRYQADLLIVGLRQHPGLLDRLVTHTTSALTERAPCSVLGVR